MTPEELRPLLRSVPQGVTMPCRVRTRSSRSRIDEVQEGAVRIALTSPPVDGKANAELCAFLAKKTGRSKSSVSVMLGETSRTKVILFSGAGIDEILKGLCE